MAPIFGVAHPKPKEANMQDLFNEFKAFLLRGNIIELAVAFVVGAAFKVVVDSLVADLIMPIIAMIGGEPDFRSLDFTINDAVFRYGNFITNVISFVIIGAAIFFFVVKPVNMIEARRKKGEEPEPEPTEEVVLLREIRDALRSGRT
jgi:large conductance mechanosensitive channel